MLRLKMTRIVQLLCLHLVLIQKSEMQTEEVLSIGRFPLVMKR